MHDVEYLDFDSKIFGFKVAKFIPDTLTSAQLSYSLALLKAQGVRLVYWASASQDKHSQIAAKENRGSLVDRKITYMLHLADLPGIRTISPEINEYPYLKPPRDLIKLALESGLYSRFKIDKRLPNRYFKRLYRSWITNSVNKKIANTVLIAKDKNRIVGMITLGEKHGRGDIGLMAVAEKHRGKQLGQQLVYAAQMRFIDAGYLVSQVMTQEANIPACRLYEKCGYKIEKIENFYHFWL